MPAFSVPYTPQEQLKVVQGLKKVYLNWEEKTRVQDMERQLVAYGFIPKDDFNYLENLLKHYGWMLE